MVFSSQNCLFKIVSFFIKLIFFYLLSNFYYIRFNNKSNLGYEMYESYGGNAYDGTQQEDLYVNDSAASWSEFKI